MNDGLRSNVSWSCGWRRREGMTAEATQHYSEPPSSRGISISGRLSYGPGTGSERWVIGLRSQNRGDIVR